MPPSQLKRLKASLREQGIVGPQKSKKQKKELAQNGSNKDKRVNRNAALSGIREQFNPFEIKTTSRAPKFEVTSNKTMSGRITKSVKHRPGVTKGLGEEARRKTLLVEMQRRNKVGGIMDRRFGENDPTMAPEDKMLERYAQESSRRQKNKSAFDLEEDDGTELTHMGQSLSFDGPSVRDDFDEEGIELSDAEDETLDSARRKRRRNSDSDVSEEDDDSEDVPERKKTKQEVMKEVIAKSKLHKYERQAAKDEDEDLREELDGELSGIHALLRGLGPKKPAPKAADSFMGMNPERAAQLDRSDKINFDKEYDKRLKQMAQDKRSQPTERTKTEDEKIAEESRKLQELERKRLARMKGEAVSDDDEPDEPKFSNFDDENEDEEAEDYGLGSGIKSRPSAKDLGFEEEDDFVIDEDLVASGSEDNESGDSSDESADEEKEDAEDDEFTGGLLTAEEAQRPEFLTGANAPLPEPEEPTSNGVNGDLAYTFSCPESHEELLKVTNGIDVLDLPIVIQRIRALYHPKLNAQNKSKLGNFTVTLIDHISYLATQTPSTPSSVIEATIRHVHSLAKTYPIEAANAMRQHLETMEESRPLALTPGDLMILTAIGSIFPTSDHFHQVVTPAMLAIGRYLGQKVPQTLSDLATGSYLVTLSLQYQRLSKRYVPELVGFLLNTMCVLSPEKMRKLPGTFVYHEPKTSTRITSDAPPRDLQLSDTIPRNLKPNESAILKASLLTTASKLLDAAADTWASTSGFVEIFSPATKVLAHLTHKFNQSYTSTLQPTFQKTIKHLTLLLTQAKQARRPLLLHNHKPLAIKLSIPKFEESFNPDKHYDPDRERAEASKLKAEYKKERKGAIRELRKDASFVARESLREKKERDAAYEKKYKRLVAEIQGEEGHESKAYEREKSWRKKGRK